MYTDNNLVSKLLKNSKLVVKNVKRMLLFPFTDEKESDVTTFPLHLVEIDKRRIHSVKTNSQPQRHLNSPNKQFHFIIICTVIFCTVIKPNTVTTLSDNSNGKNL